MPGHQRQRDHRRGGVDLDFRQPFRQLIFIPGEDRLLEASIILLARILPEAVQADAHFPFPLLEVDGKTFTAAGADFTHIFQAAEALNHLLQQAV